METIEIVRVKFNWPGKIFEFKNPRGLALKKNDQVIVVGTNRKELLGTVKVPPRLRQLRKEDKELTEVVRIASDQEIQLDSVGDETRIKIKSFFDTRLRSIEMTGVKFIDCELVEQGRKLVIYYSSEQNKFDYRTISKECAKKFGLRVDLRSVGIRDAARLAGGIGKCGLSQCCSTWLPDFQAVSIKMAKDQGVSLEPDSINGQCGRLLCCLGYEHENYVEMGLGLPKVGKVVVTPHGEGRVMKLDILKGRVTVKSESGSYETYEGVEVKRKFGPGPQAGSKDKAPKKHTDKNKNNKKDNTKSKRPYKNKT